MSRVRKDWAYTRGVHARRTRVAYTRGVHAWRTRVAYTRGVQRDDTRSGKLTDNSDSESFNGELRDECLNVTQFADITHAQQVSAAWHTDDVARL
ncbi:MAG: integrase core domain-containing protein [Gemmatimonadota bacterium]|jgi:transposase InsO family protein